MKIIEFIDDIQQNCSQIAYLCTHHIYSKIYKDVKEDTDTKENIIKFLYDYNMFLKYLNDYAGVIYRQYNSSSQEIYEELCIYLNLSIDNQYTYEHIIKKLQKQTPELIMSLTNEDIKIQTIENFEEKLKIIKLSDYYIHNTANLKADIVKLENNISLVKRALQL
jgi:hypothetical protein